MWWKLLQRSSDRSGRIEGAGCDIGNVAAAEEVVSVKALAAETAAACYCAIYAATMHGTF